MDLLTRNIKILSSIFPPMQPIASTTIILMVANPVDILTHFARTLSGLPEHQVLGTGTSLDSARLRGELAKRAEVSASSIDAYVLGEHGEGQFVSSTSVSNYKDCPNSRSSICLCSGNKNNTNNPPDRLVQRLNWHNTAPPRPARQHADRLHQRDNSIKHTRRRRFHHQSQRLHELRHRQHRRLAVQIHPLRLAYCASAVFLPTRA
jgi:hypothetical protein